MKLSRLLNAHALLIAFCGLTACGTFEPLSSEALPDSEMATVECHVKYLVFYQDICYFDSVDGRSPPVSQGFSKATRLPAGPHWFAVSLETGVPINGGVQNHCAFDLDLAPEHTYRLSASSLTKYFRSIEWIHSMQEFRSGSIVVEVIAPSGLKEVRQVPVTCGSGKKCRKDQDCENPHERCVPQTGHSFGRCEFEDGH